MIVITVPYPPSVNHCYVRTKRGVTLAVAARAYRTTVAGIVAQARGYADAKPLAGDLAVRAVLNPPLRQSRDIDNWCKSTLDALTHAGVWGDDSQVKVLLSMLCEPIEKGAITLTIAPLADIETVWRNMQ